MSFFASITQSMIACSKSSLHHIHRFCSQPMIYLALCKGETSFRFDTAVQRLAICAELENVQV